MNKFKILIFAGIFGVSIWYLIVSNHQSVQVAEARYGGIRDSVTGNVRVHATSSYELRSQSQAFVSQVASLPMTKPIKVDANQTLLQLATDDLDRQLEGLLLEEKQFAQRLEVGSVLALQLKVEEKDLNALEKQFDLGHGALFELERKRNQVERLRAQVELENLDSEHFMQNMAFRKQSLAAELHKRKILSPIDGVFSSSLAYPGKMVFPGNPVGSVHSHDKIFEVSLSEEDCERLAEGMPAAISLFSSRGTILPARVDALASSVNPESGMRKIYLSSKEGNNVPVGSSGRAEIIIKESNETLIVPAHALLGDYVLVERNGKIEHRKVTIGSRNLKTVEILNGLNPKDRVVVETPHLFKSGDRITPSLVRFKD